MIARDKVLPWGHRLGSSCHLFSTLHGADGTRELLAFTVRIGLREAWIQFRGLPKEHFDLFRGRVAAADAAGAVLFDRRQFVNTIRTKRGDPPREPPP